MKQLVVSAKLNHEEWNKTQALCRYFDVSRNELIRYLITKEFDLTTEETVQEEQLI